MALSLDKSTRRRVGEWAGYESAGTYCHDALERTRLPACGPAEAFELVVAPEVVHEEDQELQKEPLQHANLRTAEQDARGRRGWPREGTRWAMRCSWSAAGRRGRRVVCSIRCCDQRGECTRRVAQRAGWSVAAEEGGGREAHWLQRDLRWEAVSPLEFTRLSPHPFRVVPEDRRPLWASPAACRTRLFLLVAARHIGGVQHHLLVVHPDRARRLGRR